MVLMRTYADKHMRVLCLNPFLIRSMVLIVTAPLTRLLEESLNPFLIRSMVLIENRGWGL